MTVREALMRYLVTLLSPIQDVAVFRSREAPVERAEGVVIIIKPDEEPVEHRAGGGPHGIVIRDFSVTLCVIARADGGPEGQSADQIADPAMEQAHALLMADVTCGGLAAAVIEQSTKWNFEEADGTALAAEMRYMIRYQTPVNSLSVLR